MNDTCYHEKTPPAVRKALEKARTHGLMVRLMLGDPETGKVWLEENDVVGFIGRSTGTQKVPLMVEALLRSPTEVVNDHGGPQLLDHCILRIINCSTGHDLYRHPKLQLPDLRVSIFSEPDTETAPAYVQLWGEGYRCEVFQEVGTGAEYRCITHANFKAVEDAQAYIAFMQGVKTHMPLRTVEQARKEEAEND